LGVGGWGSGVGGEVGTKGRARRSVWFDRCGLGQCGVREAGVAWVGCGWSRLKLNF
jgi:hypothetical protein